MYANGKKEVIFPNGVKREIYENNYTIVHFTNSDIKQVPKIKNSDPPGPNYNLLLRRERHDSDHEAQRNQCIHPNLDLPFFKRPVGGPPHGPAQGDLLPRRDGQKHPA